MKRFILWIVICITIVIALGSISSTPEADNEINYHDSYLGAIHFNEYGVTNNEPQQKKETIFLVLSILLLAYFLDTIRKIEPNFPKTFLFNYVRILKQHENLIPKLFHSNQFAYNSSKTF